MSYFWFHTCVGPIPPIFCYPAPAQAYLQLGQIYQDQGPRTATSEQLIRYKTPDIDRPAAPGWSISIRDLLQLVQMLMNRFILIIN